MDREGKWREIPMTVALENAVLLQSQGRGDMISRPSLICFKAAMNLKWVLIDLLDLESGTLASCFYLYVFSKPEVTFRHCF